MRPYLRARVLAQGPPVRQRFFEDRERAPPPGIQVVLQHPPVSLQAPVVHARALPAVGPRGLVVPVLLDLAAVPDQEVPAPGVQPVPFFGSEHPPAVPAIALAEQDDRLEPRGARNRRPRSLRFRLPRAVSGEVDEIAAVRRDIGPPLINPMPYPLPYLKAVLRTVPQQGTDRIRRSAAQHNPQRGPRRHKHMQPGRELTHSGSPHAGGAGENRTPE